MNRNASRRIMTVGGQKLLQNIRGCPKPFLKQEMSRNLFVTNLGYVEDGRKSSYESSHGRGQEQTVAEDRSGRDSTRHLQLSCLIPHRSKH